MFMLKFVVYLITLLHLVCSEDDALGRSAAEELYIKLFKRRRVEHLEAIKALQRISNYEHRYKLIVTMAENIFTVLQSSRARIEASGFIPGVSEFPADELTKDALSSIIENTALFGEVVLRLPDITTSVLKINNNWDILLQWSIAFTNQVRYLLDAGTIRMMSLCSQELNHIPREENFVNPYRVANEERRRHEEEVLEAERRSKKRQRLKKGPRLHEL